MYFLATRDLYPCKSCQRDHIVQIGESVHVWSTIRYYFVLGV